MRHNQIWKYMSYILVLVLTVLHITACTNTSQSVIETEPITTQEITSPSSGAEYPTETEPVQNETSTQETTSQVPEPTKESVAETSVQESTPEDITAETTTPGETATSQEEVTTPEETTPQEESTTPEETTTQEEATTPEETTTQEETTTPEETTKETTSIQQVTVPVTQVQEYTGPISVKSNTASGTELYSGNGATIDASNKASGYIMAKYEGGGNKRVKIRVSLNGVNYDYDLNTSGSYEAYPLQMGNGSYTVIVMQNVYDKQYAVLHSATINVELSDSNNPYLYPSQKINYTSASAAVKKSYDLCVGLTTDEQKVTAIYNYIIQNVKYDYDKAAQITSGALTSYNANADTTLATNKGICLDYATLMAVMLRAQNIPTQMIFGSEASASYHAWNKVYYNGSWVLYDSTYGAGGATGSNYTEMKRY